MFKHYQSNEEKESLDEEESDQNCKDQRFSNLKISKKQIKKLLKFFPMDEQKYSEEDNYKYLKEYIRKKQRKYYFSFYNANNLV